MNPINVVDARMGRGKSSAAIRYMNRHKGAKRFLYITPYLDEVDRICEQCDFEQSDNDSMSKSAKLKLFMRKGKNIAATHSLFYHMDREALQLAKEKRYSLIIDESIRVIERLNITDKDFAIITDQLTTESKNGILHWKDSDYTGRFCDYKQMADAGSLFRMDSALLNIMNPAMLCAFDEIFMLTYLFDGQYPKAYLDFYGLPYRIMGVQQDKDGYYFSKLPDSPPPMDYSKLISIVEKPKMNQAGNHPYALSKKWFAHRGYDNPEIRALRNNLRCFFRSTPNSRPNTRLWTSFKSEREKLIDAKTGRFRSNFLQISARATNEYRSCTNLAYIANRFIDPNLTKFFATKNVHINADVFALSEMLQWIWRSAIRDGKPINLYIPSKRMRNLLLDWMKTTKKGAPVRERNEL